MSASLDIELLCTFHVILHFGRFLAAASHLNRGPLTVNTHVWHLEELADDQLFERDSRSVRLTPLGQRFQRQTAELLETHDCMLTGLRRRGEPLQMRFGISKEYAGKLLGHLLPRLGAELPALELEVLTGISGRLAGRLWYGQLDLTLLVQAQGGTPYNGHSRKVGGAQSVRIAGHGLRIDPRRPPPLALHGQGCPYRQALLEASGATGRRWRAVVSSPGAVALGAAIEDGLTIDVIDRARVGPMMRMLGPVKGFAELPVRRIRLVFTPGERPPALERLSELIAEEFQL